MSGFFGYGEDVFTLWALKNRKKEILNKFYDTRAGKPASVSHKKFFDDIG